MNHMPETSVRLIVFGIFVFAALIRSSGLAAPTADQVRSAFADIRDDKVPHNCEHATEWLLKNREDIKDELLAELFRTDRQGRDAILHVLFNTASFQPDERFIRFLIARLPEQSRYVKPSMIFKTPPNQIPYSSAHWEAWSFIDAHFAQFEPYLKEEIARSESPYFLWAVAWLAKVRGVFADYALLFTPEVLRRAAANLAADHEPSNASQAVRLFLLLGDQSLPTLREVASSASESSQEGNLARATIDALAGKRKAFGYLISKLSINEVLFGERVVEPNWINDAAQPYFSNDRPYR
jgi:hypothetical protein